MGAFAYMGAKDKLAPLMAEIMVYKGVGRYISLFGGGASDILKKPHHAIEIYNDYDPNLADLFCIFSNPDKRENLFKEILELPYNKEVFDMTLSRTLKRNKNGLNEISYASYVWFSLVASQNGGRKAFREIVTGLEEIQFRNKILGKYAELSRLDGIEVSNEDAITILEREKKNKKLAEQTFYFCDSPYYNNKAGYECNMTSRVEHERYCWAFKDMPGFQMICGYNNNDVYSGILEGELGFHKYTVADVAVSMGYSKLGEKKAVRSECIWTNYKIKGVYDL